MKANIPEPLLSTATASCQAEIDVLFDLTLRYGEAVENGQPEEMVMEAANYVLHCNDILYKKLVFECGLTFEQGEAFGRKTKPGCIEGRA